MVWRVAYRTIMSWEGGGSCVRRLAQLRGTLLGAKMSVRKCSSEKTGEWLLVGDVKARVNTPSRPELVPRQYALQPLAQNMLRHLRWMIQKDQLGQDMFLVGPPGPLRRHLALAFCELMGKEVEYVSLSRDTTETDLKQRREIVGGTVHYVDQPAVSAALLGRVLVVEGVEKAERNVLPVLNNLLENREMQLEDGRFILSADRYDKLLKEHGQEVLDKWRIVRASERFRVIALGLPVPPYRGNSLDPPLRSRFQARTIYPSSFQEQLEELRRLHPSVKEKSLISVLSVTSTIQSLSSTVQNGPVDLSEQMHKIATIMDHVPDANLSMLLQTVYPPDLLEAREMFQDALKKFGLATSSNDQPLTVQDCRPSDATSSVEVTLKRLSSNTLFGQESCTNVVVPGWGERLRNTTGGGAEEFVATKEHEKLLASLIQSHLGGDFCLVGPKGTGKTTLVNKFAAMLGYSVEPIVLYQVSDSLVPMLSPVDMTSRELLQQRSTLANGDTTRRLAPLVVAALEGRLAVLDGVHRLDMGTLAVIKRLVQDRELNLLDGTRLLSQERYTLARTAAGLSEEEMAEKSIFPINPNFRLVAIGEPKKSVTQGGSLLPSFASWINPELLSMFQFHNISPLPVEQEREVILGKVPGISLEKLNPLLNFAQTLRTSADSTLQSLSTSLSTRQLLRMCRRLAAHPEENLYQCIAKACLSRFLPQLARAALTKALADASIHPPKEKALQRMELVKYERRGGYLHIGQTKVPLRPEHDAVAMVPDVLFYDNQQHLCILEDMSRDFALGEHLLLVGNQGVGKNKIVDRFLYLLNLPREYLQLHRDTTVQTLTLQPSVQGGVVTYQDSPLVRALQSGMVLVVDEADKAPTHVTCILKNIIEGGEITLADGRRIVHMSSVKDYSAGEVVPMHPNFRMIVLANRPGFPFLGNDFFAALGDIFSCHAVDNPDLQSEMAMLRQYGPDVPEASLKKLVTAFSELRQMADEGLIAYPYSTREVVNIVKHLQEFPGEGIASVVRNVFDFDSYHHELLEVVFKVLHKHGIPVGASTTAVQLAPEHPLPQPAHVGHWTVSSNKDSLQLKRVPVSMKGPYRLQARKYPIERVESRGIGFSELRCHWMLPIHETNYIATICTGPGPSPEHGDFLHVVTANPISLFSMPLNGDSFHHMDLDHLYPSIRGFWRPQLTPVSLGGHNAGKILLHEAETNSMFLVHPTEGEVYRMGSHTAASSLTDLLTWRQKNKQHSYRLCGGASTDDLFAIFQEGGNSVTLYDFTSATPVAHTVSLPTTVTDLHMISGEQLLVCDKTRDKFFVLNIKKSTPTEETPTVSILEVSTSGSCSPATMKCFSTDGLPANLLGESLGMVVDENTPSSYSRLVSRGYNSNSGGAVLTGLPLKEHSKVEVYSIPTTPATSQDLGFVTSSASPAFIPSEGEIVYPTTGSTEQEPALTIVNLPRHSYRKIGLPVATGERSVHSLQKPIIHVASLSNGSIVAVDSWGTVRSLEIGHHALQRSLAEWQSMVGDDSERPLQITYERESGLDVSGPKHGKHDPTNAPHVGGNTWAGGTGGRDTAGLGGKGGPYRLDAGHPVYQVSDWEKENVPEEIKRAAREMGQKARRERLREIEMSEHDAEMYQRMLSKVRRQIQTLRIMLDAIRSTNTERQWLRHQTSGDLDDGKLIEGLTGERAIYKRRGERTPEFGSDQVYPKRIRLVVDVSGSMYRFNGHDGRLERTLEAALMVMEAFDNQRNFKLDIVGHSGDSDEVPFVNSSNPPSNDKERLQVLKAMIAESQFCWSGDHTMEATRTAIEQVTKNMGDDYFVIVLSDANFSRYGIKPKHFAALMNSDPRVNVYAIFIGSLGDQAKRIKEALPAGRSFVCMDNRELPQILQQILSSTLT